MAHAVPLIGGAILIARAAHNVDRHALWIGDHRDPADARYVGRRHLHLGACCHGFLDGRVDIFAANGHVADEIERVQSRVAYAQPAHLFRNLGSRRFDEVTKTSGRALSQPMVARGAAYGDIDNDGDLDLLVTNNGANAELLRNEGVTGSGSVILHLVGTKSNRSAIGARGLGCV